MNTRQGKVCRRGHDDGTAHSVRFVHNGACLECHREDGRARAHRPDVEARNNRASAAYRARYPGRHVRCVIANHRRRRASDPYFALVDRLRSRTRRALGRGYRAGRAGIDYGAIAAHLGPCPGRRSDYHVDHIRPLCSFDLTNPEQVRLAFAPENHQWLTAEANMRKHSTR